MRAIDAAGRADADNRHVAIVQLIGQAGDCCDAAILVGGSDQIVEPGFIHRRAAFIQRSDLGVADIDPDDGVPLAGDATCGSGADVTQSENGNFHKYSPTEQSRRVGPSKRPLVVQCTMLAPALRRHTDAMIPWHLPEKRVRA